METPERGHGQREKKDVELADKVIDYWKNRIVNNPRAEERDYIKPRGHNCNQNQDRYKFNGIGMISHFDEFKRWHLLSSMIYLAKKSQPLGDEAPARSKTMTRGELPRQTEEHRGRRRQLIINGETVMVSRQALYVSQFIQPGDMV